jgi:hypothetical protein
MYSKQRFALEHDSSAESALRSEIYRAGEEDTIVIIQGKEKSLKFRSLCKYGLRNARCCVMQTAI